MRIYYSWPHIKVFYREGRSALLGVRFSVEMGCHRGVIRHKQDGLRVISAEYTQDMYTAGKYAPEILLLGTLPELSPEDAATSRGLAPATDRDARIVFTPWTEGIGRLIDRLRQHPEHSSVAPMESRI